jgi:hypothetical protein
VVSPPVCKGWTLRLQKAIRTNGLLAATHRIDAIWKKLKQGIYERKRKVENNVNEQIFHEEGDEEAFALRVALECRVSDCSRTPNHQTCIVPAKTATSMKQPSAQHPVGGSASVLPNRWGTLHRPLLLCPSKRAPVPVAPPVCEQRQLSMTIAAKVHP